MSVDIAKLKNGKLALVTDESQPCDIKHIEYFKEQRLFQVIYENSVYDDWLIEDEFSPEAAAVIEGSPAIMVVVMAERGQEPYGYHVPLKQIDYPLV